MNLDRLRKQSSSWMIRSVLCFFTLAFYVGALCAPDLNEIFSGFARIVTNPAQLTKDYFRPEIGSISGAFFNTALVGTVCCALLFLPGAVTSGLTVTGYMLTVGFSFWGMNLVNILPFMFGTFVYSLIKREPFAKFVNFAMFSTALGPLASEMLYRYPGTEIRGVTLAGVGLALLIGVATGVAMPALCAHAKNFHKGYSLYNAGRRGGLLVLLPLCDAVPHARRGSSDDRGDYERRAEQDVCRRLLHRRICAVHRRGLCPQREQLQGLLVASEGHRLSSRFRHEVRKRPHRDELWRLRSVHRAVLQPHRREVYRRDVWRDLLHARLLLHRARRRGRCSRS